MPCLQRAFLCAVILCLSTPVSAAVQSLFYREANLIGGVQSRDQWTAHSMTLKNSVGFEDLRKFSGPRGDFLTTNLQARLAFDETQDRDDAWAIEIHNAWADFNTGLGKFLIGHNDPAFGLEYVQDTHGVILQNLAPHHLGFKKDWGARYKKILSWADVDASIQTGSGMALRRTDGSHLAAARLGLPDNGAGAYGFSVLYGEVLRSDGMGTIPPADLLSKETVRKKRIAVDARVPFFGWEWTGELMAGEDNHNDTGGALIEAGRSFFSLGGFSLTAQLKTWDPNLDRGSDHDATGGIQLSKQLTSTLTARAAVLTDIHKRSGHEQETFLVQLYYYGR